MPVELFERFIKENNLDIKPIKSEQATTTAQEAANVHKVPVSNIVKSLVVKADDEFFIILCPGDKKLDFSAYGGSAEGGEELRTILGRKNARMATADEVKEITGHSVGGVPPFGHKQPLKTIILDSFNPDKPLWAAAGRADTNFQTSLPELKAILKRQNLLFKVEP